MHEGSSMLAWAFCLGAISWPQHRRLKLNWRAVVLLSWGDRKRSSGLLSWLEFAWQDIREEEDSQTAKTAKVCMGFLLRLTADEWDVMHSENYQEANRKMTAIRLKAEHRFWRSCSSGRCWSSGPARVNKSHWAPQPFTWDLGKAIP